MKQSNMIRDKIQQGWRTKDENPGLRKSTSKSRGLLRKKQNSSGFRSSTQDKLNTLFDDGRRYRPRASRSLEDLGRARILERKRTTSTGNKIEDAENPYHIYSDLCAKRLETFRLNEEIWHRNLRILCIEYFTWRNRPHFWQYQLRGLQKKDFYPLARVADGTFMKVFAVKPMNLPSTRKVYAMKIIERISDQLEEIVKEFDVMLKLSHSVHFPSVHGFFFDRDCFQACFVMEYLDGISLMQMTYAVLHPPKEPRRHDFERVAHFYTMELVRAVAFLHNKVSVPHGDLKNDNIMITLSGHLKVFDFDFCGQYSVYHHTECYHRFDPRKDHAVRRYFRKEIKSLYPPSFPEYDSYEDIFRVMNIARLRDRERRHFKVRALSGHRAYRSPEYTAMPKKGQFIPVKRAVLNDWWAVGVLVYELFMGIHPFAQKDPDSTYPRFRAMNIEDVINFKTYQPVSHSFIAERCGNPKVATFIRCLLTDESNRIGSKPFAVDIKEKGIECGLTYFEEEDPEPPFKPKTSTIEHIASIDRNSMLHANKHYKAVSKENRPFLTKFPFYNFAAL